MNKHLVVFKGKGIHKDAERMLWGQGGDNPDVKAEREIEFDGDREAFLANRPDIAFMVEYGEMTVVSLIAEEPKSDNPDDGKTADTQTGTTIIKIG